MNHYRQNLLSSTPDESSTSYTKIALLHQGYSLAETIMKRYKLPPEPCQGYITVVTIVHATIKAEHTFDVW